MRRSSATFAPMVLRRSRNTSKSISMVLPRGSTRSSVTRPTGTPLYRTGLATSSPLTFSLV